MNVCTPSSHPPAVCLKRDGILGLCGKVTPPPPRPLVGSAASLPPSLDPEAGRPLMQGQWDRAMAGLPCLANTDLFAYDASSR